MKRNKSRSGQRPENREQEKSREREASLGETDVAEPLGSCLKASCSFLVECGCRETRYVCGEATKTWLLLKMQRRGRCDKALQWFIASWVSRVLKKQVKT